jgi:hypothetical protein
MVHISLFSTKLRFRFGCEENMDRVKQTLEASRAVCPRIVSWPTLVLESRVIRWHLRKCFYCIPRGESTYVPALFQTVTAIAAPIVDGQQAHALNPGSRGNT